LSPARQHSHESRLARADGRNHSDTLTSTYREERINCAHTSLADLIHRSARQRRRGVSIDGHMPDVPDGLSSVNRPTEPIQHATQETAARRDGKGPPQGDDLRVAR